MKQKRILFRADGDAVAGYGHVIRSLSLASMLKRKYHCVFLIRKPDAFLEAQIRNCCDELIVLPQEKDLRKEARYIAENIIWEEDIVVLDGYIFKTDYQAIIRNSCFRLVCIDDIFSTHFVADAIINHSEGISEKNYSKEFYTRLYSGVRYMILRSSFLKKPGHRRTDLSKPRIFINMGGTDQQNYTEKALKQCLRLESVRSIDIVTGSYYPFVKRLEKIGAENPQLKIRLHSNIAEKQMRSLMNASDLALCSASTISYEYCCSGGLLFVFKTVPNQANIYSFLVRTGCAFPAGKLNQVMKQLRSPARLKAYFSKRARYFDGNSPARLSGIFEGMEKERALRLKKTQASDLLTYFRWANDPEVRQNAVNTAAIPLDSHRNWFLSRIKNGSTSMYVAEKNGKAIGQVRFDRHENIAEIDYSVSKANRGKGLGQLMLKIALEEHLHHFPSVEISAMVKAGNTASGKVFLKLGFRRTGSTTKKGVRYEHYRLGKAKGILPKY
jgi:UDP-2,4-diacetamido-2,4,6-trideoxy-beta-L-altropyranose hydrolase